MGSQLQYPTHSTCALLSSSRIFYQKITQSEMKAIISIQNRANILIRNQENILFRNHRNVARHPESTWSRELDPLEKIGQHRYRWSRSWRSPEVRMMTMRSLILLRISTKPARTRKQPKMAKFQRKRRLRLKKSRSERLFIESNP